MTVPLEGPTACAAPPLRRFPNTSIGIALGFAGNSLLWRTLDATPFSHDALGDAARSLNWLLWVAGIVALLLATLALALKAAFHTDVVRAEYRHPVRCHFYCGPHIAILMLALGTPHDAVHVGSRRAVFASCAVLQAGHATVFYSRWLFSEAATLSVARPPYLLSTVGWFLLAVLAQASELEEAWQLPLAAWCFGAGCVMYSLVVIAVFLGIKDDPGMKGQPALFLLLAPSSVAALALQGFTGGFGAASQAVLGYNMAVLLVLVRLGPQICRKPAVLGTYWAYVFPLAALATCGVQQAGSGVPAGRESFPAQVLAWVLVALASTMLVVVMLRLLNHHTRVLRVGEVVWEDPILAVLEVR